MPLPFFLSTAKNRILVKGVVVVGGCVKKSAAKPGMIAISAISTMLTCVIITMLITSLVIMERIGEAQAEKLLLFVWLAAGVSCGMWGNAFEKVKKIHASVAVCIVFACIMLAVGMLLFEGGFVRLWLPMCLVAAGCILSYIFCARKGSKVKRKIRTR